MRGEIRIDDFVLREVSALRECGLLAWDASRSRWDGG